MNFNDELTFTIETIVKEKLEDFIAISTVIPEDFISKTPSFYLYYPLLFVEGKKLTQNELVSLSYSGVLIYTYVMIRDRVEDDLTTLLKKEVSISDIIRIKELLLVEVLSTLSGVVKLDEKLWDCLKSRFVELQSQYLYENTSADSAYFDLCDSKSALGKFAIDTLFLLGCFSKDIYDKLLLSHKHFSVGLQIFDDYLDIEDDFNNKQTNCFLRDIMPSVRKIGAVKESLYVSGRIVGGLNQAVTSLETSVLLNSNERFSQTVISLKGVINKCIHEINVFLGY